MVVLITKIINYISLKMGAAWAGDEYVNWKCIYENWEGTVMLIINGGGRQSKIKIVHVTLASVDAVAL